MQFGYSIIYVKDVKRTIEFYESCFGFQRRFLAETGEYGELETGATRLAFAAFSMADKNGIKVDTRALPNGISPIFEVAFITKNVETAFHEAVAKGAVKVKDPELKPWGQTVGYLKDLNGVLVEIASPM
ncbi:MAG: VOC family protein [Bdellovibrionaceae bacterium]|nr:VOC family protein [Pseudobdellovibrionaceae bacterium]